MVYEDKARLKNFIETYIPFDELKKVGFFKKDIRRTDYEAIAERVCYHFSYKSIYEYKLVCRVKSCPGINCTGDHELCKAYKGKRLVFKPFKGNFVEMVTQKSWLN